MSQCSGLVMVGPPGPASWQRKAHKSVAQHEAVTPMLCTSSGRIAEAAHSTSAEIQGALLLTLGEILA